MKRIYVCSKLRGDSGHTQEQNEMAARHYAKYVVEENYGAPFVPHLLYPQFLDDAVAEERVMGMEAGMAFMDVCEELIVFMNASRLISEGMVIEIKRAFELDMPVRAFVSYSNGTFEELSELVDRWVEEGLQ